MDLESLLTSLRENPGFTRKAEAGRWARSFMTLDAQRVGGRSWLGPGDDAGAVEAEGGFLLLCGEGLDPALLEDPRFAGFASVTVCANDIYAMGGRPLGMVSMVFSGDLSERDRESFLEGLGAGLDHYQIPLLGGHSSPGGAQAAVSAAMLGAAGRLVRSDSADPGDELVVAVDLEGRAHPDFPVWDSVTSAKGEVTLRKLEALVEAGKRCLCSACRDISNPGLLGTIGMICEASGVGAHVELDAVPVPTGADLAWWLTVYPSIGFILAAPRQDTRALGGLLESKGLSWSRVGEVTDGSRLTASIGDEKATFIDWRRTPVTGLFS